MEQVEHEHEAGEGERYPERARRRQLSNPGPHAVESSPWMDEVDRVGDPHGCGEVRVHGWTR